MMRTGIILPVFLLLCHQVVAQHRVSGKVQDKDGPLSGAIVTLGNTGMGSATDSAGYFELRNVADGTYELRIDYAGYETYRRQIVAGKEEEISTGMLLLRSNTQQIKGVTVSGTLDKGSRVDAIKQTRASSKVVTILSAENIARLPDKNVAEAVQRVAGVKMERNKGEGSTVSLRGTPTDWTATLINGDRLPTADEDDPSRTFQFEVFPSCLVDNITVTRTVTPDIEADNIGGAINFQTIAPPDKQKLTVNLGGGLNWIAQKPLYELNISYGNTTKDKKLSYVLSGSYYKRAYGTDALRLVYGSNYNHAINRLELKDYFGDRTTIGVDGAVLYRPTNKLTIGAHFMHGRMDDDKWQYKTTYNWADGAGKRLRTIGTHGLLERRFYGSDLTAEWKLNPKMTIDAKVATYYNSFRYGAFPYEKGDPRNGYMNYQFINDIGTFNYTDLVTTDFYGNMPKDPKEPTYDYKLIGNDNPYGAGDDYRSIHPLPNYVPALSSYYLETAWSELNETYERDPVAAQLNYTWKYNDKIKFKAGGKFRYKEGSREISKYEWILNTDKYQGLQLRLGNQQLDNAPRNSTFLNGIGTNAYNGMLMPFMTKDQMTSFLSEKGDSVKGRAMNMYNSEYSFWVGSRYKYSESVSAGYVMAEVNVGSRLKLVGGLRIENTHFKESGDTLTNESAYYTDPRDSSKQTYYQIPATQSVDRNYIAFLPSLNANLQLNSVSNLRLAMSRTFHRPNFEETKPGFAVIKYEDAEYTFGNPDLKPTYSLNFDATYERYWGNKGIITLGIYYKDVTDHIFTRMAADADPKSGNLYKFYENAGKSFVMGAEASIDRQFSFLKGFWSGFGINANITYSYSRMQVPGREEKQAMTEQTPLLYNIALYYDRGRVNARIGLNYTGAYLKELNLAAQQGIGLLHKDTDYDLFIGETYALDFQASVQITRYLSTYGSAGNLLNAPYKSYIGQDWRVKRIEYYGPRFQLGLKFAL